MTRDSYCYEAGCGGGRSSVRSGSETIDARKTGASFAAGSPASIAAKLETPMSLSEGGFYFRPETGLWLRPAAQPDRTELRPPPQPAGAPDKKPPTQASAAVELFDFTTASSDDMLTEGTVVDGRQLGRKVGARNGFAEQRAAWLKQKAEAQWPEVERIEPKRPQHMLNRRPDFIVVSGICHGAWHIGMAFDFDFQIMVAHVVERLGDIALVQMSLHHF